MNPITEERFMILRIPYQEILQSIVIGDRKHFLDAKGLPDGYKVACVHNDHLRRNFEFLIAHESFEPVEPSEIPPELSVEILTEARYEVYDDVEAFR